MACACNRNNRENVEFIWTSANGGQTMTYSTEIEAKAKVLRKGGSYMPSVIRVSFRAR